MKSREWWVSSSARHSPKAITLPVTWDMWPALAGGIALHAGRMLAEESRAFVVRRLHGRAPLAAAAAVLIAWDVSMTIADACAVTVRKSE